MEPQSLTDILVKHPDSVNSFNKIKALLFDYYPNEREEIIPLLFAYDAGIVEKIKSNILDDKFVLNNAESLQLKYGLDNYRSFRVILLWCIGYGVKVLGKRCEVDGSDYFYSLQTADAEDGTDDVELDEQARAEYSEGIDLYTAKSFTEAVKRFKDAADHGLAEAQYILGVCYEEGKGIARNLREAFKWFLKSAEQGNPAAQSKTAVSYYSGYGVHRNYDNALIWAQKAAEQEEYVAMVLIGQIYDEGLTGERNFEEAYKWFMKAAQYGETEAMYKLGNYYNIGRGVNRDPAEAAKWYLMAAEKGHAQAQANLAQLYFTGAGVNTDFSLALYWAREAAKNGQKEAVKAFGPTGMINE